MKLQAVVTGLVLGLAVLTSGCGSKQVGPAVNTGFFENYTNIETPLNASLKKYTKIQVAPIQVVPAIELAKQTQSQKKMYKAIVTYLNKEYRKIITASGRYTIADKKAKDTLVLQSAISTVEVHFDDKKWNQLSPIAMGLDVVSFNAYMYEFVRVLGEMRLVDSVSGEVITRNLTILKDEKVSITGDDLKFKNLKPGLDAWLRQVKVNLEK